MTPPRPPFLRSDDPTRYLGADQVVETDHPEIVDLAKRLRREHDTDEDFSATAFKWVRDEAAHSVDAQDPRVTLTASDVLRERVGLCYAKSHLLVAVLRAGGVPAGLCYQRLRGTGGHVLHGLVAVHLREGWHRLDPRGNRPGFDAQFSLDTERLAYVVDESLGEVDYPIVMASPASCVVEALEGATDVLELCRGGLPSELVGTT